MQSTTRKINKILKRKESEWTEEQKKLRSLWIQKKIAESQSLLSYTKNCSKHAELEVIISKHSDLGDKIVKTELSHYCKTHESERGNNPDMFKIMIPHDQRLENLLILLGDNNYIATAESSLVLDLLTIKAFDVEFGIQVMIPASSSKLVQVNEMCVVVWMRSLINLCGT